MIVLNEKGFLTNERIANWTDKAHKLYEDALKGKNKPSPKVRLSVEETLLRFREKYGDKEECSIVCYKNRTLLKFVISQQGDPLNPLIIDEDYLSVDILGKLDLRPRYVYKPWRRQNRSPSRFFFRQGRTRCSSISESQLYWQSLPRC